MFNIILNEWKILFRNQLLLYSTLFFIVVIFLVVWLGIIQNENQEKYRLKAQKHIRAQWENLNDINPHGAAHYGTYAFKPINLLNSIDSGIDDITGNVIKLEGHVQNEIAYSEASQSLSISKFGKLKSSIFLQYVIPLILIFLAYGTIINERDSQRLRLLVLHGLTFKKIIFAKSLSIWIYGFLILLLTVFIQTFFLKIDLEIIKRLFLLISSYGLYYYVVACISTYFSAKFKNNTTALSLILVLWIIWTVFLPKISGNAIEKIYQLPSRMTFKSAMNEDRDKGIDGHNPYDKRREDLKKIYLEKYKVDSLKALPINFDGIVMQEDEEHGNIVWDKHFGNNYSIFMKQKYLYQISSLINPFASLQSLSMGFCGTDMIHHLHFLKKAEDYRRYFIKTLNDKHAYGGSKTGDWKWTVDKTFFKSVGEFSYETPKIKNHLSLYILDMINLFIWAILLTILISAKTSKNIYE